MYVPPRNDVGFSQARLDSIMRRRRLSFNPYTVSDSRLMEIIHSVGWGNRFRKREFHRTPYPFAARSSQGADKSSRHIQF